MYVQVKRGEHEQREERGGYQPPDHDDRKWSFDFCSTQL
jgi:hypothetical protein